MKILKLNISSNIYCNKISSKKYKSKNIRLKKKNIYSDIITHMNVNLVKIFTPLYHVVVKTVRHFNVCLLIHIKKIILIYISF